MKEYLVKIRFALSGLIVYKIKTDNIYRVIGKIYCTSIEHIQRVDFSVWSREGEQFWLNIGYQPFDYEEPILSEEK